MHMEEDAVINILGSILSGFSAYARDGETLMVNGDDVVYDYSRGCQDPSYAGEYHDRQTFSKSALLDLIRQTLSSPDQHKLLSVQGLKESLDDIESLYTGHKPGNVGPYSCQMDIELEIIDGQPVFRTDYMWPMSQLKPKK